VVGRPAIRAVDDVRERAPVPRGTAILVPVAIVLVMGLVRLGSSWSRSWRWSRVGRVRSRRAGAVRRPTLAVVATFTVLALVPSWLVEQRYDIIPFALWLAVAPEESPRVETITSVACVTTALVFVHGIQNGLFFL